MRIEQIITDSVMLTEKTGIPVLFLSNPGLGKTTILKRYAEKQGYHLETLIGSRFSPEEISGYMVNNGGDHLTHMSPDWFDRITKKAEAGITTLLFIDEISTCSEAVQGALLSLIFDRTIGSNKYLPEDCIIVSAANYARNLPSCMNLMAPTLNRFILINLNEDYKAMDLLEEFIDTTSENTLTSYTPLKNLPADFESVFKTNFKLAWKEIFLKYSDSEAALGYLDISNRELDGLYSDCEDYVYNFISGRTLSYLCRVLIAYIQLGMENDELLNKVIDGLVGNGTCDFKNKKQLNQYRNYIHKMMHSVITKKQKQVFNHILMQHDIIKDIQSYMINIENLGFYHNDNITQVVEILDDIRKSYTPDKIFELLKTKEGIATFTSQMEAIIELQQSIAQYPDSSNLTYELTKIGMDYYGLYCDIMKTTPKFESTFGCGSNLFDRVVFLSRNDKYVRAALRKRCHGVYQSLYLLDKSESLVDGNLKQIVHDSDGYKAIYWDEGIKSMTSEQYVHLYSKKIA